MKRFLKKEIIMPTIMIIFAIVLVAGVSYAIFRVTVTGEKNNVINAGTLKLTFADSSSNSISLTNAVPVTDTTGMTGTAYTFTVTNTGNVTADYHLKIEENETLYSSHGDTGNILQDNKLKIGMTKNGTTSYLLYDRTTIDYVTLAPNESVEYTIRVWIDHEAGNEVQGKHFHGKFIIDAVQTSSEDLLVADTKALIDNIGTVSYNEESKLKISRARSKYNTLSDAQIATIENGYIGNGYEAKLIWAEATYTNYAIADTNNRLNQYGLSLSQTLSTETSTTAGRYIIAAKYKIVGLADNEAQMDDFNKYYDAIGNGWYYGTSIAAINSLLQNGTNSNEAKTVYYPAAGGTVSTIAALRLSNIYPSTTRAFKAYIKFVEIGDLFEYVLMSDTMDITTPSS